MAIRGEKAEEQCLYLVPENNDNDQDAVMLHNGKQKLGNVAKEQARMVRAWLATWKVAQGSKGEDVLVCSINHVTDPLYVYGNYRVNERLARKFSNKYRKEI